MVIVRGPAPQRKAASCLHGAKTYLLRARYVISWWGHKPANPRRTRTHAHVQQVYSTNYFVRVLREAKDLLYGAHMHPHPTSVAASLILGFVGPPLPRRMVYYSAAYTLQRGTVHTRRGAAGMFSPNFWATIAPSEGLHTI